MDRELTRLLAGLRRMKLHNGLELRLLSAQEVLEARREAADLSRDGAERALCSNACLLARALEHRGRAAFENGQEVLRKLSAGQIEGLAKCWASFNERENPSPEDEERRVEALKKVWSTRLMSALSGVCSRALGCFRARRGPER